MRAESEPVSDVVRQGPHIGPAGALDRKLHAILFDPEVRFPQATTYKVEIPAGTKSQNGGVLKEAVKFTFETPAAKMISH